MTTVAKGTTFLHGVQRLVGYMGAGQDRAECRETLPPHRLLDRECPEQEENFGDTLRVITGF